MASKGPEISKEHLANVPPDQQAEVRKGLEAYAKQYGEKMKGASATKEKGKDEEKPEKTEKKEDIPIPVLPDEARSELERRAEKYREKFGESFVDRGPVGRNMIRSGVTAGAIGFVPAYMAQLSGLGSSASVVLGAGGGAIAGWHLGKWLFPKTPRIGKYGGATAGTLLPSVGVWSLGKFGTLLTQPGGPALATGVAGAAIGWNLGGKLAEGVAHKIGREHAPRSAAIATRAATGMAGLALGSGVPYLPAWLGGGIVTNGLSAVGAQLANGASWLHAYVPTLTTVSASLPGAVSLGATAAAGGAGLYALGRLEGKLWDRKTAGVVGNVGRGAMGMVTIPAWLLWKPTQKLYQSGGKALQNNVDAVKRMFTGQSKTVKAVSAPVWWPVRTMYRFGRGVYRGVYNGLTGSLPSDLDKKQGVEAKLGRALPYAAGRVLRSPIDLGKWLLSPTWKSSSSK